jgi:hypothetical protein
MKQESKAPKGVNFSDDFNKGLVELLMERHGPYLAPGESFACQGLLSHGEVKATIVLSNADESSVVTIEGRIDLELNDIQNPLDARDCVVDFLEEVIIEYFERERMLRPNLDWKEYTFGGNEIAFRGSVNNAKLDRMADEWLEKHGGL